MPEVYGTEWAACLQLVINALNDSPLSMYKELAGYLVERQPPPNAYEYIEVSIDVVNLVKAIAPATTLTSCELTYVLDECNIILKDEEREGT